MKKTLVVLLFFTTAFGVYGNIGKFYAFEETLQKESRIEKAINAYLAQHPIAIKALGELYDEGVAEGIKSVNKALGWKTSLEKTRRKDLEAMDIEVIRAVLHDLEYEIDMLMTPKLWRPQQEVEFFKKIVPILRPFERLLSEWMEAKEAAKGLAASQICKGQGEGPLSYFKIGGTVYDAVYQDGVVRGINFEKEEVLVFFDGLGEKRRKASLLSVACGCLENERVGEKICVGNRVAHIMWRGAAKAVAVNYFYDFVLVRFFFNNGYLDSDPRYLRLSESP